MRPLILLVPLLLASAVAAQAPRITPKGDPSVDADSIYRLAVKASDYPEESAALLLDDGVIRMEADGRGSTTYRQIVQILKPDVVDSYREQRFSWSPGHERFTINWIRVVKPDGEVISAAPSHVQDSDVPATMGDPVYSDRKVRRVSLTGVEPGTIIDYSYTREELKPFLPGDFFLTWSVSTGLRTARSRYIVDVPADLDVHIRELNLNFKRQERVSGGRRVLTWATRNMERIKPESFVPDSDGVFMSVYVSSPTRWSDIARWYAGNARDRYAVTPAVQQKLATILAPARTLEDSIRAVHRWVAQDIRYVSIALGLGGYQPRSPDTVVKTGFGDCKDKATLFVAALRSMGVTAYPVLLNSSGGVKRDLPAIEQFDHATAAIQRPGGYEFVDLTSEFTPLGELPFPEQGEFGLVVHPDGSEEEVTFPSAPLVANRTDTRIVGTLAVDGTFDGHYEESAAGADQYSLRDALENPLDSTQRADVARAIARKFFENADGDSLVAFSGKDLTATPKISLRITNGHAATASGGTLILTNPIGSMSGLSGLATELEKEPRRFPIDARKVLGASTSRVDVRITLPVGWHARLPDGVDARSDFGSYVATYTQNGRELRLTREMTGATGSYPRERIGDLTAWLRTVAADNAKFIVLEKDATGTE